MDYSKQIRAALHEALADPFFNESEIDNIISETFEVIGTDYEKLNKEIEVGVLNGHSPEFQISLIKAIFN